MEPARIPIVEYTTELSILKSNLNNAARDKIQTVQYNILEQKAIRELKFKIMISFDNVAF